jgi:homeodomain-containing protein
MLAGMKLTRIIDPPDAVIDAKFTVTLTPEERAELTRLVSSGRHAAQTLNHARVLLQTDIGPAGAAWTDAQIRAALGVSERTVARIRRTFVDEGLDAALHRRPRSVPKARKLDGRAEAHLIALQCSPPPEGRDRWTLALLTEHFVALGISPPVSDETVRRTLKQTGSSHG